MRALMAIVGLLLMTAPSWAQGNSGGAAVVPAAPKVTPVPVNELANQVSGGLLNGRHWRWLPADGRIFFLEGYAEALSFATLAGFKQPPSTLYPASSTINEIVQGLDLIYVAPENARIPICFALGVFQMKVAGSKEVDIEERLRYLREVYAADAPAKK